MPLSDFRTQNNATVNKTLEKGYIQRSMEQKRELRSRTNKSGQLISDKGARATDWRMENFINKTSKQPYAIE